MAVLARENPTFKPAMRIISTMSQAHPVAITTTFDHNYESGLIVRLDIPLGFGMQQVNGKAGTIIVTSATQFTMGLDTTTYDAFAVPPGAPRNKQYAHVVPIAEDNDMLTSATRNVLPY